MKPKLHALYNALGGNDPSPPAASAPAPSPAPAPAPAPAEDAASVAAGVPGGVTLPGMPGGQEVQFASDIEEEANSHFQKIYSGATSIADVTTMLRTFQASSVAREQQVYACMVRHVTRTQQRAAAAPPPPSPSSLTLPLPRSPSLCRCTNCLL